MRRTRAHLGALMALSLAATTASAEDRPADPGQHELRQPPRPGIDVQSDHISKIIFLNRCVGGCTILPGWNDARDNHSSILQEQAHISEFAHGDEVWDQIVQCVREIYGPYDVEITDVDPGENVFHHEAIVAGTYDEIDYDQPIGGIAPSICEPNNNVISFTFANGFSANPIRICEVIGQESAHSFGLEHAYDCADPMTYLPRCGRQFFRDRVTPCGEYTESDCFCGGEAQNSHRWLTTVLGESDTPVPGPEVDILRPEPDAQVADGFEIAVTALHMRGIGHVELHINGTEHGRVEGHSHDRAEQAYWFDAPAGLADGVLDVEIRAYDDIGSETVETVTVTKGAPCTSADDCNEGQQCDEGRCFFPPATGELGDPCTTDSECVSGLCPTSGDEGYCSESCFPTPTEPTCPDGFDCVEVDVNTGVCWPATGPPEGGCGCSGSTPGPGALALLGLVVLGVLARRREG